MIDIALIIFIIIRFSLIRYLLPIVILSILVIHLVKINGRYILPMKINRVYIINSTRLDCKTDIEDAVNLLDVKPHYYWKQISNIYYSLNDIKKVKNRLELYIKFLVCDYILIPEYTPVSITDEVFLYEFKIAGIFRKEIRWYK